MKGKEMARLMGLVVTVSAVLRRRCKPADHLSQPDFWSWRPENLPLPRAGWVAGFGHMQEGYRYPGYYDEPGEFKQTGRIACVKVTWWPTCKPVMVPLDGYEVTPEAVPVSPSRRWTQRYWQVQWTEQCRDVAAEMPRDSRGRFTRPAAAVGANR